MEILLTILAATCMFLSGLLYRERERRIEAERRFQAAKNVMEAALDSANRLRSRMDSMMQADRANKELTGTRAVQAARSTA